MWSTIRPILPPSGSGLLSSFLSSALSICSRAYVNLEPPTARSLAVESIRFRFLHFNLSPSRRERRSLSRQDAPFADLDADSPCKSIDASRTPAETLRARNHIGQSIHPSGQSISSNVYRAITISCVDVHFPRPLDVPSTSPIDQDPAKPINP